MASVGFIIDFTAGLAPARLFSQCGIGGSAASLVFRPAVIVASWQMIRP
jgi:hypothetical protein